MRYSRNILATALLIAALPAAIARAQAASTRAAGSAEAGAVPAAHPPKAATPDIKTQFWFGVAVENIPPSIARQLKLKPSQGLMVSAVLPNSPAEKAGLKPEDLLIEINDRPLTSQEDLFLAANSSEPAKFGPTLKSSRLTYLREGDRTTVEITPEQRPANMIVFASPDKLHGPKFTNYATPSGGGAQVSPGYRINLDTNPGDFTVKSIKAIVAQGKTVVLSQETDMAGGVKNTITLGATVYIVDPLHVEALPEDLRPLAQQLIDGSPAAAPAAAPKMSPSTPAPVSLEQRVKELEAQNAELRKQMQDFLKQHEKDLPSK